MIVLHNTLSRRKEELHTLVPGEVRMYVCGPTVYDYFHIGNARCFVVFDTIRRYLAYRGYAVKFVQNYTDIDDKMIKRAEELGITVAELADRYIAAYEEDAAALGIAPADIHPRATEHIPQIVDLVRRLEEKGFAYEADGDVYFDTSAYPAYGRLSQQPRAELEAGARVEVNERKRHPMDFALWKAQKPGEPAWDSPWGRGRPGWHIECSAMAMTYLGETIDIHAGGADLVFPHHENEVAQSEAATGKPFARYWLHNAYLNIQGEKMSKSLGNFRFPRDLRLHYDPEAIRFFLLSAHYRSPLNFSEEQLAMAASALERLYNTVRNTRHLAATATADRLTEADRAFVPVLEAARARFIKVMDDDFNTADAQAVLFDLAREVNGNTGVGTSRELLDMILDRFREMGGVLGLLRRIDEEETLDGKIQALVDRRQEARRAKNWAEADRIRDQLAAMGIILEDTPQGVRWKRKG